MFSGLYLDKKFTITYDTVRSQHKKVHQELTVNF